MKTIKVGIVGDFQSGKSTLINCLFGRSIASVGNGTATTHTAVTYSFGEDEGIQYITNNNKKHQAKLDDLKNIDCTTDISQISVFVNSPLLHDFTIVDMPGLNFNDSDNQVADTIIKTLDLAIVITTNEKAIGGNESSLYANINLLKCYKVPYYLIMNCTDVTEKKWHPSHPYNHEIMEENLNFLNIYSPLNYPFENQNELIVNFLWYWYIAREDDEVIKANADNLILYGIRNKNIEAKILEASNFNIINKIFSMDNKMFLELRKEFIKEIDELRDEVCPIGTIQVFASTKEKEGWLPCDGRELSKEDYPELFKFIGFTFGGDNKSMFQIPDLRGRFVRGYDNKGKVDEKRKFGSTQDDAIQGHEHKISQIKTLYDGSHKHDVFINEDQSSHSVTVKRMRTPDTSYTGWYGTTNWGMDNAGYHTHDIPEHNSMSVVNDPLYNPVRIANETRPKNIALLYCIKANNTFKKTVE